MDDTEHPRGADGFTRPEAIGRRALINLERLMQAYKTNALDFAQLDLAIECVIDATMPFVDQTSKEVMTEIGRQMREGREELRSVDRDLEAAEMADFGAIS